MDKGLTEELQQDEVTGQPTGQPTAEDAIETMQPSASVRRNAFVQWIILLSLQLILLKLLNELSWSSCGMMKQLKPRKQG